MPVQIGHFNRIGHGLHRQQLLDGLIEDLYRLSAESIIEGDFDDPLAPEGASAADLGDFLPDEMEF